MYLLFFLANIVLILCVDTYFYQSVKVVSKKRWNHVPDWIKYSYWGFTVASVLFMFLAMSYYIREVPPPPFARSYGTGLIMIITLSKLVGIIFFLFDDIRLGLLALVRMVQGKRNQRTNTASAMDRASFLRTTGLVAAGIPFVSMFYGVVKSAFDYRVYRKDVHFDRLPAAFDGLRVVQISDIHSGSFVSSEPLKRAVDLINEQQADLVFFTGDLVNEVTEEAQRFSSVLSGVQAPLGVHSVLGNHDYGDYFYGKDDLEGKAKNRRLMIDLQREMGWDLLLNDHRTIERGGEKLGIVGVENWGKTERFPRYGDIAKATTKMDPTAFNILLSHDPSHWDYVVSQQHPDMDLTLSGHTHGFQMGIEVPGYIKWSPSQYMYRQWGGLYHRAHQSIYVNRGLGFIGYPGRLGILPEITVLTLRSTRA